jgi:hypothetical protein
MRVLIFVLIIAVVAILVAIGTGFLNINQIRGARAPEVSTTSHGVTAKGGQAPAFDVETGSVKVGSKETKVKVPALIVEKPKQKQATNNAQ